MKRSLVIGSNGQDGTFLVKHLLSKGYDVIGIDKQERSRWEIDSPEFQYYRVDLRQEDALAKLLNGLEPKFIFHVAAVHASAGGSYEFVFNEMLQVNVASVHTILEYLRVNPSGRFIYASSAKVFGDPLPAKVDEDTPKKNECLYSISKNTAYHLIEYYRAKYRAVASVVYLFNHESELRPDSFFIPTILRCLASATQDPKHVTEINTLDFFCDWGSAYEYTSLMIEILEKAPFEDFVLARGTSRHARLLVDHLFREYGLNWELHMRERFHSSTFKQLPYIVDLAKLNSFIHRTPVVDIHNLCKDILRTKYCIS